MGVGADLLLELRGLAALGALLLLPGLLVVRAPWSAVPFLSAGFWILSWWWLSPLGPGREAFLHAALGGFAVVLLLRLWKPLGLRQPGWPVLLVVLASLLRLLPVAVWPVAPGAASSRQALLTLLLTWHDGLLTSYEPLLRVLAPGIPACGLAGLAADVTLLSGLPAHRSALLVACAGLGLFQIALFALLARFTTAPAAAFASVLAVALAALPQGLLGQGASDALLALALLTAAAAVLARATSRSRAVAAGWMLAAALATDPGIAPVAALGGGLLALAREPGRGERLLASGLTLLVCAAPFASRIRGWSIAASGDASLGIGFLLACAAGLSRGLRDERRGTTALVALAALLLWAAERREAPLWAAAATVILCSGLARLLASAGALEPAVRAALLALLAGAAVYRGVTSYGQAQAALAVNPDDLQALAYLAEHTTLLEGVCGDTAAAAWIPGIAGRGSGAVFLDALERPTLEPRPCAYRYLRSPAANAVFRSGDVAIAPTARAE